MSRESPRGRRASPAECVEPTGRIDSSYACNTVRAFEQIRFDEKSGWGEQRVQWNGVARQLDGTEPGVTLIRMRPGAFYCRETRSRTLMFLCVAGAGTVTIEILDRECNQHIHHVVTFSSEFTDSIAIPPFASFRFYAGLGAAERHVPHELHLIEVEPGHCWPEWLEVPNYVNPGAFQAADFKRSYEGLSRMHDRQPTPFYAPDPNQRARRHRIWGREGLDLSPGQDLGERDFVKPFTHLVLYTFYMDQKNFEHYHPHSWEFVYCIQGRGTMRLREYLKAFDDKDLCTSPYRDPQACLAPGSRPGASARPVPRTTQTLRRESTRARRPSTLDAKSVVAPEKSAYPAAWGENWYSWEMNGVSFDLTAGTAVLVPRTWLHEYQGIRSQNGEDLLLVYAMQTPQPIMHLLEHQANGWNPHCNPIVEPGRKNNGR